MLQYFVLKKSVLKYSWHFFNEAPLFLFGSIKSSRTLLSLSLSQSCLLCQVRNLSFSFLIHETRRIDFDTEDFFFRQEVRKKKVFKQPPQRDLTLLALGTIVPEERKDTKNIQGKDTFDLWLVEVKLCHTTSIYVHVPCSADQLTELSIQTQFIKRSLQ